MKDEVVFALKWLSVDNFHKLALEYLCILKVVSKKAL